MRANAEDTNNVKIDVQEDKRHRRVVAAISSRAGRALVPVLAFAGAFYLMDAAWDITRIAWGWTLPHGVLIAVQGVTCLCLGIAIWPTVSRMSDWRPGERDAVVAVLRRRYHQGGYLWNDKNSLDLAIAFQFGVFVDGDPADGSGAIGSAGPASGARN